MNPIKKFISVAALPVVMLLSSCKKNPELEKLFNRVIDNKTTRFTYKNEIFTAMISSTANNARMTCIGDKWTVITLHDTDFSWERIISEPNDNITLQEFLENIEPIDQQK